MRNGEKRMNDVPELGVFGARGDRRAMAFTAIFGSAFDNDLATDLVSPEERADR